MDTDEVIRRKFENWLYGYIINPDFNSSKVQLAFEAYQQATKDNERIKSALIALVDYHSLTVASGISGDDLLTEGREALKEANHGT